MNEYIASKFTIDDLAASQLSHAGLTELTVTDAGAAYIEANGFTPLSASLENEIDELGVLEPAYKTAKKIVADYETRLKMLREGVEQHVTGSQALRARGAMFAADLTEPAKTRVVKDINKVVQILGAGVFLKYAKFNVTDVDAVIAPERREEVIGFKEGNRKLLISKL